MVCGRISCEQMFGPVLASAIDLNSCQAIDDDILVKHIVSASADNDSTNGSFKQIAFDSGTACKVVQINADDVTLAKAADIENVVV